MMYITCEYCGANLDYGEKCDCTDECTERNETDASADIVLTGRAG